MKLHELAEIAAQVMLMEEFKQDFFKQKIKIGKKNYEFDHVSKDGQIVAQVKSCKQNFRDKTASQIKTLFRRDFLFDVFLLSKVSAYKKIFFLVSDEYLFKEFKSFKEDFISHEDVEIKFINKNEEIIVRNLQSPNL